RIIKAVREPETGAIQETPVAEGRPIISRETAQALRSMLAGATGPQGTGFNARVEGFPVAGKTGTAQKAASSGRGYIDGAYISSFAGFLPAQNPKYVIFIVVDHPKNRSYYGAQVAAPVFSRIASFITRLEGWAPVLLAEKNLVHIPKGEPATSTASGPPRTISMVDAGEGLRVPQFRNWTAREVLRSLEGRKIDVRVVGSGVVHETLPAAGSDWGKAKYLTLFLRPRLMPPPTLAPQRPPEPPDPPPPAVDPLLL
ncbi:MAG: hypothetical protein C5B49_10030, partial [Bdellovibrio sp.]